MKDVLDDHLELYENDKWKIGKIMLLTGVFLMLSMTLLSLLKEYFPEGFAGIIVLIVVILLSRDLTHRINILDKNIREYMLGIYVFVTFFLAHLVYKTFILTLIIEGLGWFYNFSYCIYSALGIAGFAFVIAYFVIHKIRSKPTLLPILLMLCYILFAVILVMTRVNNY